MDIHLFSYELFQMRLVFLFAPLDDCPLAIGDVGFLCLHGEKVGKEFVGAAVHVVVCCGNLDAGLEELLLAFGFVRCLNGLLHPLVQGFTGTLRVLCTPSRILIACIQYAMVLDALVVGIDEAAVRIQDGLD